MQNEVRRQWFFNTEDCLLMGIHCSGTSGQTPRSCNGIHPQQLILNLHQPKKSG